jgi:hypothetical protein
MMCLWAIVFPKTTVHTDSLGSRIFGSTSLLGSRPQSQPIVRHGEEPIVPRSSSRRNILPVSFLRPTG